jgi:flagellar hook-length control protein FliK
MRIDDSQPSSSDPAVKSGTRDKSSTDQNKDSSFSKVLAKKREGKQDDTESKPGKQKDTDPGMIPPGLLAGPQALLEQSMQPTAVQSKSPVQVPPELQGLVREISSLVNVKGNQQVNIELNSNVLKGLHIQIERQKDGAIAIKFQSSSEAVTQLLSKNMDALSQGLIDRGVNVADINVSGSRESSTGTESSGQGSGQASGQSSKTRFGGASYPAGRQGGRR